MDTVIKTQRNRNKKGFNLNKIKRGSLPYMFTVPAVIIVGLLLFYPLVYGVRLSFQDYTIWNRDFNYVGLDNYIYMFTNSNFWISMQRTFVYAGFSLVGMLVFSILLALFINREFKGRIIVRTAIIAPMAASGVAVGIMWKWLLAADMGIINHTLRQLGIDRISFLSHPTWAMASVIFATIWFLMPISVIMFLGALQGVAGELYESADIDGATSFEKFRYITVPFIMPTVMVVMIYNTMSVINHFDSIVSLTGGGPINATRTLALHMYETSFAAQQFSYGAAMSMVLLAINLIMMGVYSKLWKRE